MSSFEFRNQKQVYVYETVSSMILVMAFTMIKFKLILEMY